MTGPRSHGPALLSALKNTTTTPGPALVLPAPGGLTLRPVGTAHARAEHPDVKRLTEWRNRHVAAFLTEFEATPTRTMTWLRDLVGPDPGRIIFMLDTPDGRTFGHLGLAYVDWLAGHFEVDGVVRGESWARGGMTDGLATLVRWAITQLGLTEPRVRVRSDNPRAVAFYRRLGFAPVVERRLRRVVESDMLRWVEDDSAPPDGPSLIHMVWHVP